MKKSWIRACMAAVLLLTSAAGSAAQSKERPCSTPTAKRSSRPEDILRRKRSSRPDDVRLRSGEVHSDWYRRQHVRTVVVFVHGFNSNGVSAFLCEHTDTTGALVSTYFPELVYQDSILRAPDIGVVHWWTGFQTGNYSLARAAENLYDELRQGFQGTGDAALGDSTANLIFVTHSTGGLLVNWILATHAADFTKQNVGLFLLASPGKGAFTNFSESTLGTFSQPYIDLLLRYTGAVQPRELFDTNATFMREAYQLLPRAWNWNYEIAPNEREPLLLYQVCETEGLGHVGNSFLNLISGLFRQQAVVVAPLSCQAYQQGSINRSIIGDHFDIAKPASTTAPPMVKFRDFAQDMQKFDKLRRLDVQAVLTRRATHLDTVKASIAVDGDICVSRTQPLVRRVSSPELQQFTLSTFSRIDSTVVTRMVAGTPTVTPSVTLESGQLKMRFDYGVPNQGHRCTPLRAATNSGWILPEVTAYYSMVVPHDTIDQIPMRVAVESRLTAGGSYDLELPCPEPTKRPVPGSVRCNIAATIAGRMFNMRHLTGPIALSVGGTPPSAAQGFVLLADGTGFKLRLPRDLQP